MTAEGQNTRSGRVTIRTVADDAGVSFSAVSKVLRNAPGVSDQLRQKVLKSIARLGYRPNVAARSMRGKTRTIGVLLANITNPFLPDIVGGITGTLDSLKYKPLIGIGKTAQTIETSLIESMIDSQMDGLILVAPRLAASTISRYAKQIPIVVVGHHCPTADTYDTVNADDRRGAAIAIETLIEAGHSSITMATLVDDVESAATGVVHQREIGYRRAMEKAGLADRIALVPIPVDGPGRKTAVKNLLTGKERARAIFCWSDLDGIEIVNYATAIGLRLPQDLAIVSYDNSRVAAWPVVGLSSVDQAAVAQGQCAAELLIQRIEGRTRAEHVLMETKLIRRASL